MIEKAQKSQNYTLKSVFLCVTLVLADRKNGGNIYEQCTVVGQNQKDRKIVAQQ